MEGQVENTLGSFLAAIDAGVGWVEVDVRRTLDDQLFVAHDAFYGSTFMTWLTAAEASRAGAPDPGAAGGPAVVRRRGVRREVVDRGREQDLRSDDGSPSSPGR